MEDKVRGVISTSRYEQFFPLKMKLMLQNLLLTTKNYTSTVMMDSNYNQAIYTSDIVTHIHVP